MECKSPILISKTDLTELERLRPSSYALKLSADGLSTATLTLTKEESTVAIGDWVRLFSPTGDDVGVFYVKGIDTSCMTEMRTISLEHCFGLLAQAAMNNGVMANNTDISARFFVETALKFQESPKTWKLGAFEFDDAHAYSVSPGSVLSVIENVTASLEDCYWEFDMKALPFTCHLRKYTKKVESELRINRNLGANISYKVDTSGMFTVLYPIGRNNLNVGGDGYQLNVAKYGRIAATQTNSMCSSKEELKAWAAHELKRHAHPYVSVSCTALELSKATGEPLDKLKLGRVCRLALPEYNGATVEERITSLSWQDVVRDPVSVSVTLSNERRSVSQVAKAQKEKEDNSNGGGGAGGQEQQEENKKQWTEIRKNDEHIQLLAVTVDGVEGDPKHPGLVNRVGSLEVTSRKIEAVVKAEKVSDVGELLTSYSSRITQTAYDITLKVSKTEYNGNTIVSMINQTPESVTIKASKINLEGYVKATQLETLTAKLNSIFSGDATISQLSCSGLRLGGRALFCGSITVDGVAYSVVRWGIGD